MFLLALLPGCRRAAPAAPPGERPNVLLVTIDTLRADRVGCYGHAVGVDPRPRCPGRPWRPLRDRGRPRSPHGALPRFDPHRAGATRSRLPGERRLLSPRAGEAGGRGLPAGRLPDRGLRLRLPPRPPLRLRPRLRDLRRPPAEGQRPPPHARTSSASPTPPPTPRCAGSPPSRVPPPRPSGRSSSGSTTTTPTRPTSRRVSSPRASGRHPTTARSRSRTSNSGGSSAPSRSGASSPAPSWSRCRTTARAWASTARAPTASSSTTRRSRSPSSWPAPASPPGASRRPSPAASTCCRRSSTTPA